MKTLLKNFDENKVDIYISYLNQLKDEKDKDGKLKNWWYNNIKLQQFADIFKKVHETGLFIDGDSVTLNYRKKLIVTYDYHAYKNKVTLSYPETIFDFQVVYNGDSFTFKKESGKVIYSHTISDPFNTKKEIIGAYGVIKNKRGEFIELLHMGDINKMKNTSTMKNIWDNWFDRMVLKSVIKRICSVHFHDITKDIDDIDNEINEPQRANIPELLQKEIEEAKTEEKLTEIYKSNIKNIEDRESFIQLLGARKTEILGQ